MRRSPFSPLLGLSGGLLLTISVAFLLEVASRTLAIGFRFASAGVVCLSVPACLLGGLCGIALSTRLRRRRSERLGTGQEAVGGFLGATFAGHLCIVAVILLANL